jgi:hypothetical protein
MLKTKEKLSMYKNSTEAVSKASHDRAAYLADLLISAILALLAFIDDMTDKVNVMLGHSADVLFTKARSKDYNKASL